MHKSEKNPHNITMLHCILCSVDTRATILDLKIHFYKITNEQIKGQVLNRI